MGMRGSFARVPAEALPALRSGATDPWEIVMEGVDVDKAWHGMHFLLTGEAWSPGPTPAGRAVMGGEPVGDDGGYGPVRLLEPDEVRAVAVALGPVGESELRARFDPQAMGEVYPSIWDEGDDAFDYVWVYFQQVRALYLEAAQAGDAVLIAVS